MANTILQEGTVNTEQVNTQLLYAKSAVFVGDVNGADELHRQAQLYVSDTTPGVMESGYVYDMGILNSNQDLSNISFAAAPGYVQTCEIWLTTGPTSYLITWPSNSKWPGELSGVAPTVAPAVNSKHRYVIRAEADGTLVINKAYSYSVQEYGNS